MNKIVVLGGYGNFGSQICKALATDSIIQVLVAGRNLNKASELARQLGNSAVPISIDYKSSNFAAKLSQISPDILIHTSGPFQEQDYSVARACIDAGIHYIDIADGRGFVAGITALDSIAVKRNVLVIAGASSLPALSSAVIDKYVAEFSQINTIRHGISSSARPPGIATMQGVMSYVGKNFKRCENNQWKTTHGWQNIRTHVFPEPVGRRWLADCDVPDLELFPNRYKDVSEVTFQAGLGFAFTTWFIWLLSWAVRYNIVSSLVPFSGILLQLAKWLKPVGTKWSGMYVQLSGSDNNGLKHARKWYLLAGGDHGPNIPCLPAIALARKMAQDEIDLRGALPCMGLLSTEEILTAIPNLDIRTLEV